MNTSKTAACTFSNLYAENKKAILAVSYGTSRIDSINKAIGPIEAAIARANADYEVRRAFTSQIVIDTVREKYAQETDNVEQALEKLIKDGIKALVIQPTHITYSYQYNSLVAAALRYKSRFAAFSIGAPLLADDNDFVMLADAIIGEAAEHSDYETAVILIGHGINSEADSAYSKLQDTFNAKGRKNFLVGTINAVPSLGQIIASVKAEKYKKVILRPLMITAGVHTWGDVSGEKNSWKAAFEAEGFETDCILKGMGEIKAVQNIYAAHARDAVNKLDLS